MAKSKAANVITAIVAAFLSILLVTVSVATPVYMSLSALVKPDKMVQIVNKVGQALIDSEKQGSAAPNFSALVSNGKIRLEPAEGEVTTTGDSDDMQKLIEEYMEKLKEVVSGEAIINSVLSEFDLPETAVEDLMDSKAAQEILTTYAEDVSKFIVEGEEQVSLTEEKVKTILNEHIDDVVEIAKQSAGITLSHEEIKAKIQTAIETNAKEIAEAVPPIEQISSVVSEDVQTTVRVFTSPKIAIFMIATCIVLAIFVFLCRMRKFGGFLWIGIDMGVATLILTAIYTALSKTQGLIENSALNILVGATVSVYMETVLMGIFVLLAAAVLFIALFITLRLTVVKKKEEKLAVAQ